LEVNPSCPACSLVTILTELPQLLLTDSWVVKLYLSTAGMKKANWPFQIHVQFLHVSPAHRI